MNKAKVSLTILALTFCSASATHAVMFDWATVGNAGNTGELSGEGAGGFSPDRICGAVDYNYRISKHEVTNAQYAEFLNRVAKSDPASFGQSHEHEERQRDCLGYQVFPFTPRDGA